MREVVDERIKLRYCAHLGDNEHDPQRIKSHAMLTIYRVENCGNYCMV